MKKIITNLLNKTFKCPRQESTLTLFLAEILKKLLKTTQKTTQAKRQVVPNRQNGIPNQTKPKAP